MVNENNSKFNYTPLKLFEPNWDSQLASIIIDLEKLRVKKLGGPVPPYIFFQLKNIFQMLESLGSARIEGNHTTLAEFVERIIEDPSKKTADEEMQEIFNIERAIEFIEKIISPGIIFNRALVSEIHKKIVEGLTPPPQGEGSRYPGELRPINVSLKGSKHVPPEHFVVPEYFEELVSFINQPIESKNDLLVTALAHHRMAWIHPFDNGNGRMIRMFTYALLIKQGFQIKNGRILNPTAIFCMDRDRYYEMLALADTGQKENVLKWCEYVLEGLRTEIEKIDKLLNKEYLVKELLLPALVFALDRKLITEKEYRILQLVVREEKMCLKSADLEKTIGKESSLQRSRIIRRLREKNMLIPLKESGRIYTVGFINNYLLRGIISILIEKGFVSDVLNKKNLS